MDLRSNPPDRSSAENPRTRYLAACCDRSQLVNLAPIFNFASPLLNDIIHGTDIGAHLFSSGATKETARNGTQAPPPWYKEAIVKTHAHTKQAAEKREVAHGACFFEVSRVCACVRHTWYQIGIQKGYPSTFGTRWYPRAKPLWTSSSPRTIKAREQQKYRLASWGTYEYADIFGSRSRFLHHAPFTFVTTVAGPKLQPVAKIPQI